MGGDVEDSNPPGGAAPTLQKVMADYRELDRPTRELLEAAIEDDAANNMY